MKCLLCGDRTFLDEEGFCSFKCEGAYEERERIIKLLKHESLEMPGLEYEHFADICLTCENIALIKGEK
jgi:hypothetical protein